MKQLSHDTLQSHLKAGNVYRRDMLASFSKAVDRDLISLVRAGILEKVSSGMYYRPAQSRFGTLPPKEHDLVRAFLRDNHFLLLSWNQYNMLGLGLTQLYNKLIVYNRKRHGKFLLGGRTFDFRRCARGFPKQLTPEFLLVDLINNLKELRESRELIQDKIQKNLTRFNINKLNKYAKEYGKIATQRFFKEISN